MTNNLTNKQINKQINKRSVQARNYKYTSL